MIKALKVRVLVLALGLFFASAAHGATILVTTRTDVIAVDGVVTLREALNSINAGADVNAVNEADFTALHGAAFRGLNEVIQILVDHGAHINARDFRGRTAYRLAEGAKQSFQFQAYPETAEFIAKLGADVKLGVPGTVQERNRDLGAAAANQKQ